MDNSETLIINGLRVERCLLNVQPIRHCDLAKCQGICCSYGVLLSIAEKDNILCHADIIKPHLPQDRRNEQLWFLDYEDEKDKAASEYEETGLFPAPGNPYGEACIFLRPDTLCALQVAATVNGMDHWALKPFYCALYPLVIDNGWLILDDENELYTNEICCKQQVQVDKPLHIWLKDEFAHALGQEGYRQLCQLAGT